MATSDILGLFTTPEQYKLAQQQAQEAQALQYAKLDPTAQAQYGFYRAGQQLGGAIGGALGGEDPQLKMISQRQQLASQLDDTNPNSYMMVAEQARRAGDPQFAMAVSDAYRQLQTGAATLRKTTAEATKAELTNTQEAKLRDELSKLPPNASEADVLAIVTKYGSPDKVLAALQRSTDMRGQIEAKKEIALEKIEAQKQRDLDRATTQKERDEAQRAFEERMNKLDRDSKESLARLAGSFKQPPAPSITTIVDPTNPNQMISIDTRQYKQGGGIGASGVIGVSGKEPTAAIRENKATEGKGQLQDQLDDLRASFTSLNEKRAITSQERNPVSNLLSSIQGSTVGQVAGRTFGTKEQTERNLINSAKQRISTAIKNATGMSSQQLNSNFELKSMLDSLSDVNLGYEASMEIIDRLERDYVKGGGMKKEAPPAKNTPSGQTSKGTKYQVLPD